MPLKLSVGLSKKVGLPDYGSLGASCNVEVELDGSILQHDLDAFHRQVRNAFAACHQAVHEQLGKEQHDSSATNGNGHGVDDKAAANGNANGRRRDNTRRATASQVRALNAITDRRQLDLAGLLAERFGTRDPAELSIVEASGLIDELKGSASNGNGGRR